MLTEKDYCDYETSRELKELGFVAGLGEDDCGHCLYDDAWHDQVDRPLLYEAQKWLREEKKIDVGASWDNDEDNWFSYIQQMGFPDWSGTSVSHSCYSSYEEALSEGVRCAVKILKEK